MRQRTPSRWRCVAGARWSCALVALAAVSLPAPARAQSTLAGGRGTPLVPDADTVPPTHFTTSFGAAAAGTSRDPFQAAPAGVTFGFSNDLDVGLGLRTWSQADPEARGASVDPLVALKLRLLREAPGRPGLALGLGLDHAFQGLDLSPSVILQKNRGPLLLTGELGWRLPLRGGPADAAAPFAGIAAGYWLSASTSFFVQALGEAGRDRHLWLMPGVAWSLLGPDPFEKRRESLRAKAKEALSALETELGTQVDAVPERAELAAPASAPALAGRAQRLASPGRVTFFVTGGPSLGVGPGWRVFAGIQISSFDEFLQDSDGDGIPDRVDRCPYEPEDWDGYEDGDGCPDHGAEVLRKLALDRLAAAAAQGPKLTTPFPRFRLRIPLGEVPDRERGPRDVAPMYRPLDAPPTPAPAPAAAPPAAPAPNPARPSVPPTRTKTGDRAANAKKVAAALPAAPVSHPRASSPPAASIRGDAAVTVAVMVLPPVSIVKRPPPLVEVRLRGADARAGASVGVEREVMAAAFARFSSPDQPLSDRDREAIDAAIRTAGAAGGELLIWARARETALVAEAARRADAIAALAAREGMPATTRVTTSPETWGPVDVQVSATSYRVRLPYAAAPEPSGPGRAPEPAPLDGGDPRRQLREAALAHRGEIERCLSLASDGLNGEATDAVVRIAVEPDGSAVAALERDSPLWRPSVDTCLAGQARRWRLPLGSGGYAFDLPVSVTRGSGAP